MRTCSKRLAILSIAGALFSVGPLGCDDTHSADKRVREAITESRLARLKGDGERAQQLLDQAANEATATPATRAHAKALLAHAEMDAASHLINDPETGIDKRNREVMRLTWEIGQLADQIRSTNTLVGVYRGFEPKEVRAAAQEKVTEATGAADKMVWFPHDKVAIPTLAAVKQEIAKIQNDIAKLQEQIKTLQGQQAQTAQNAEAAYRDSETKRGRENLVAFKQASGLRKAGADLTNQIDVMNSNLARLQADLAVAQAREQALGAAIDLFQQVALKVDEGWKNVEQQILQQQQLATSILSGRSSATAQAAMPRASIAQKAAELQKEADELQKVYGDAEKYLSDAAKHFEDAANAAEAMKHEVSTNMANLQSGTPMREALETLKEVYNSSVFHLGQADATLALAALHTRRAEALSERKKVTDSLALTLKNAGLSLPKELADPSLNDALKSVAAQADGEFKSALDLYSTAADAPDASEGEKAAGRLGTIYANYGHSLLARAVDDPNAKQYLADAKTARDVAMQAKITIPALPSELVAAPAPPTTAPAPSAAPAAPAGEATSQPAGV